MLKRERLMMIKRLVQEKGIVTVKEMIDRLGVSDMTVRRDLDELAQGGNLVRVHGGAQSIASSEENELSHGEKREIHLDEKKQIAKRASQMVQPGDTIYIGPGTTQELIENYLPDNINIRVVTNSLPIFQAWKNKGNVDLILVGGTYRKRSETFIGGLTNDTLANLKFNKAFVGVNGIHNESIMTANTEEGIAQTVALNNAHEKIILADQYKINRDDFYQFYNLYDVDCLVTNQALTEDLLNHYQQFAKIILATD
ncbi:DeoR family transcriptional regulator [Ligilactobacillus salitolerans]|uniref:Lactose phosphotransferase system repressor n=1 Tax=Ligilactobacillus salitolerans TaxID=1808352 RepID=A0A401IQ78_9LACO|nr:DeoR/GlpR family DNA-binding transcription regulator [Ligilactobacillus salitolerans]GBG93665.1 DeoR family transcriptional regulator [Ligilactobacillus salitolerans]